MISKAAYLMHDHMRHHYKLIGDIAPTGVFFARGRLPFPQGLCAIGHWFHGQPPAAAYAHRYFMERQSYSAQPSTQLQLTEELQGVIKVMGGLRYMSDDSSKLDNTMTVMTDYSVTVSGRMLYFAQPQLSQEKTGHMSSSSSSLSSSLVTHFTRTPVPVGGFDGWSRFPPCRAGHEGRVCHARYFDALHRCCQTAATVKPSYSRWSGDAANWRRTMHRVMPDSNERRYEAAQDACRHTHDSNTAMNDTCMTDKKYNNNNKNDNVHNINHSVADATTTTANNNHKDRNNSNAEDDTEDATLERVWDDLFMDVHGGYTVLYNPCELNSASFVELIHKLHTEQRTVAAIVLPTRQVWRHVQLYADAFPTATLVMPWDSCLWRASEAVHVSHPNAPANVQRSCGMRELATGVMGMTFPDWDEAEDGPNTTDLSSKKDMPDTKKNTSHNKDTSKSEEMSNTVLSSHPTRSASHRAELTHTSSAPAKKDEPLGGYDVRMVDDILSAVAAESTTCHVEPIGLRASDVVRCRLLRHTETNVADRRVHDDIHDALPAGHMKHEDIFLREGTSSTSYDKDDHNHKDSAQTRSEEGVTNSKAPSSSDSPPLCDVTALTAHLELHHVPGDALTNEYVLYDRHSGVLACSDIFHGAYGEFDPVGSWMCRVWFKLMRGGDFNDTRRVPRFKWGQVCRQHTLAQLRCFIDALTRRRFLRCVVAAHGTPPHTQEPANTLRQQWGLAPLAEEELPHS